MASMDDRYLKTLFTDFGTKTNSIRVYVEKVKADAEEINSNTIELVDFLKSKYETIDAFRQNKKKVNPASAFAMEATFEQNQEPVDYDAITNLDQNINQTSKQINHSFDKAKKELQTLAVMFQDMTTLVNEIYDTYTSIIEERAK